jgi:hypothetical protein
MAGTLQQEFLHEAAKLIARKRKALGVSWRAFGQATGVAESSLRNLAKKADCPSAGHKRAPFLETFWPLVELPDFWTTEELKILRRAFRFQQDFLSLKAAESESAAIVVSSDGRAESEQSLSRRPRVTDG